MKDSMRRTMYIAMVFHLGLSTIWSFSIVAVRTLSPDLLKNTVWLHATFTLYSFLLSFGFSTLVRLLSYEKKILAIRSLALQYFVLQLVIVFSVLLVESSIAYVLSMAAVYNCGFALVNLSVSMKSYCYTITYCFLVAMVTLGGILGYLFGYGLYFKILALMLVSFIIAFFLYSQRGKLNRLLSHNIFSEKGFREAKQGPVMLGSVLPLRVCIYMVGAYFGSGIASSAETAAYADVLVYFGVVSVIAGRFFLFNEQEVRRAASRGNFRFFLYQLIITSPFCIYAYFNLDIHFEVVLAVALLFSSREIYGLHVNFMSMRSRTIMVISFCVFIAISWLMLQYCGRAHALIPASLFVTVYYLIVKPLKRSANGYNTKTHT